MKCFLEKQKDSKYYNKMYRERNEFFVHYSKSMYKKMWEAVYKIINEMDNNSDFNSIGNTKPIDGPKILEIGCGTGGFAHLLYDRGYKNYEGFDFSPVAIKMAGNRINREFFLADVMNFPFNEHDFDIVIGLEVFEHITEDLKVIGRIPKNKIILISLPMFSCDSHIRVYEDISDLERFRQYIHINRIIIVDKWIIFSGITK